MEGFGQGRGVRLASLGLREISGRKWDKMVTDFLLLIILRMLHCEEREI